MHSKRQVRGLLVVGGITAVAGFGTLLVFLFQPWRSCPYDDTAAACAMLPGDAAILTLAKVATIIGLCAVTAGMIRGGADRRS